MNNESQEKPFDTKTALRLIDPRGAGIPLLPLAEFEHHQSTLFWTAIFFGFFTATLGSLTSLLTTAFSNYPVIYLLAIFLASYFIFFVVFAARGFRRWRKLKKKSLGSVSWSKESLTDRISALERRIQLYKIHNDVGTYVFNGINTLPYDDFNKTIDEILPFEADDPRRKKFNQKLISEGIITIDKSESDNWTVSYETDFEVVV
ncbi:MAG: hypothetical protein JSU77_08720 [Fidelibacterota bacterium]|nr:MAG: hypothetical protein JSU77_08720 [Candidatus Neomarinimicrobiota bacterium]